MQRAQRITPTTSLQPLYSILARDVEDQILPFAHKNNIGVIVYSPMHSGLLTGAMTRKRIATFAADDWRRLNPDFQEPALSRNLRLVELMREIGDRYGRNPGEVAIAWTLHNPAVTAAIVGVRSAAQVDGILGGASFRLNESEFQEIESAVSQEVA
jgi:aryl-alcohol dehydrogenase-like predicted oxidoreductase